MFNAGTYEISNVHIFPFDQKQFFDFPEQNMNTLYYTVGIPIYINDQNFLILHYRYCILRLTCIFLNQTIIKVHVLFSWRFFVGMRKLMIQRTNENQFSTDLPTCTSDRKREEKGSLLTITFLKKKEILDRFDVDQVLKNPDYWCPCIQQLIIANPACLYPLGDFTAGHHSPGRKCWPCLNVQTIRFLIGVDSACIWTGMYF